MPLSDEHAALIPEDIRSDSSLASFNDFGSLAKSYVETKKMVGNSIQLPTKDSKPEEIDKWAGEQSGKLKDHGFTIAKLGDQRPDSPDKYEFKFEGVEDEAIRNDKILAEWRKDAHELELSNPKAQAIVERFAKKYLPMLQPPAQEVIEGEAVKAVWSEHFKGDTVKRVSDYTTAFNFLKSQYPALEDIRKESSAFYKGKAISVLDHPVFAEILSDIGAKMAQDFGGGVGGIAEGDTLESVTAEINAIRSDASNPWFKGYNNDDRDDPAKKVVMDLYKKKQFLLDRQKRSA